MSYSLSLSGHVEGDNAAEVESDIFASCEKLVADLREAHGEAVISGSFSGQHVGQRGL